MYNLSRKEANSLISIIHESLGCDSQAAYERLVTKLKHLAGGNCSMDLSGGAPVSGWICSRASGMVSRSSDDRAEAILNYALPHVQQAYARAAKDERQNKPATLSRREQEVLQWMSEGKCTWEISRILRITERTVHYHCQNIMRKLEATSRSHAVSIALKQRIIALQ